MGEKNGLVIKNGCECVHVWDDDGERVKDDRGEEKVREKNPVWDGRKSAKERLISKTRKNQKRNGEKMNDFLLSHGAPTSIWQRFMAANKLKETRINKSDQQKTKNKFKRANERIEPNVSTFSFWLLSPEQNRKQKQFICWCVHWMLSFWFCHIVWMEWYGIDFGFFLWSWNLVAENEAKLFHTRIWIKTTRLTQNKNRHKYAKMKIILYRSIYLVGVRRKLVRDHVCLDIVLPLLYSSFL